MVNVQLLASVIVAETTPGHKFISVVDPAAGTVKVPPGLKFTVYPPVPPVGVKDIAPLHAELQVTLEETDVELIAGGCVSVGVNVREQPFVSKITNVFTPAHKFVNVEIPADTGTEKVPFMVTVYGPTLPPIFPVIEPLHKPKQVG